MSTRNVIWTYIKEFMVEMNGYPPTRRQILDNCPLQSLNTVNYHIKELEKMGKITLHNHGRISIIGGTYAIPDTI